MTGPVSYRSLLKSKDTARILLAINVPRLAGGLVPFGLVAFYASRDDFPAAGISSAVYMVVGALTAPYKGRLLARFSPRRLMVPMSIGYGLLVSLAIWAEVQLHSTSLAVILVGLGVSLAPPVGAVTRSIWVRLGSSQDEVRALHSLDSVLEEATFAIAPFLSSLIWVTVGATWIVPAGSFATVIGTAFVLAVGMRSRAREVFSTPLPAEEADGAATRWSQVVASFALYRRRTTIGLLLPMLGLGVAMGALSIGLPSLALEQIGNQAFSGVILGLISATGAVVGLVYGKFSFRQLSSAHQYQIAALIVLAAMAAISLSGSVVVTVAGAILLGAGMTPMFIASYVLIGEVAHVRDHTELNASIGSGFNLGDGLATITTGFLLGIMHDNGALGITAIAVAVLMTSSLLLSGRRSLMVANGA